MSKFALATAGLVFKGDPRHVFSDQAKADIKTVAYLTLDTAAVWLVMAIANAF